MPRARSVRSRLHEKLRGIVPVLVGRPQAADANDKSTQTPVDLGVLVVPGPSDHHARGEVLDHVVAVVHEYLQQQGLQSAMGDRSRSPSLKP